MPGFQETRLVAADQQRGPPSNLQGLLKFCVENTASEDAPNSSNFEPMPEERRKWLSEALQSMSTNVIEVLDKAINDLKNVEQAKPDDDITVYETAFETILDYIDQIDTACDFHKIGGFRILFPCLKSKHPKLRAEGAEILAVLCQNNPYCQNIAVASNFLPELFKILEKDDDTVALKVLSAISGIAQNHSPAFNQFIQHNGPNILLKALNRTDDRIIRKITFMLNRLCELNPNLKSQLISAKYIPKLSELLENDNNEISRGSILSLLACLSTETKMIEEVRQTPNNLTDILGKFVETYKDQEDYLEEVRDAQLVLSRI